MSDDHALCEKGPLESLWSSYPLMTVAPAGTNTCARLISYAAPVTFRVGGTGLAAAVPCRMAVTIGGRVEPGDDPVDARSNGLAVLVTRFLPRQISAGQRLETCVSGTVLPLCHAEATAPATFSSSSLLSSFRADVFIFAS